MQQKAAKKKSSLFTEIFALENRSQKKNRDHQLAAHKLNLARQTVQSGPRLDFKQNVN